MNELEELETLVAELGREIEDAVAGRDTAFGDMTAAVGRSKIHEVLVFFKERGFNQLLDIGCVDYPGRQKEERFELVYILYSIQRNLRIRLKVSLPEKNPSVPTATDLYQAANWAEREAYEMFGFNFVGHTCQRRLLTHDEFEGHPLRKDYPVMGGQWCSTTSDLTEQLNEEQGGAPE